MICPNCGNHTREGAKFCDECGIVLPTSAPRPTAASASFQPTRPADSASAFTPPTGTTGAAVSAPPARESAFAPANPQATRKAFTIIAGAMVFVLCCICSAAAITLFYLTQGGGAR